MTYTALNALKVALIIVDFRVFDPRPDSETNKELSAQRIHQSAIIRFSDSQIGEKGVKRLKK